MIFGARWFMFWFILNIVFGVFALGTVAFTGEVWRLGFAALHGLLAAYMLNGWRHANEDEA